MPRNKSEKDPLAFWRDDEAVKALLASVDEKVAEMKRKKQERKRRQHLLHKKILKGEL